MAIVIFVVAVVWGSLSAKFLVQTGVSFIIALLYLTAILFSKVSKVMNMTVALMAFLQSIMFGRSFLRWQLDHERIHQL